MADLHCLNTAAADFPTISGSLTFRLFFAYHTTIGVRRKKDPP